MPTMTELKTVSLKEQIKLQIPQEVLDKIRFTCNKINTVEWSGILFYKITGSIKDVEGFSIECKDILLMDKGNKTYTEYSFDNDVADFIMDNSMGNEGLGIEANPEFMSYKIGHIHSHNSMGVFFSGTDMGELFDNCVNHNFYLSLIVNNFEDMIAKLVYRAMPCAYEAKDENGEIYEIGKYGNETAILFIHDCIIDKPEVVISIEDTFRQRLEAIIKKADEPKKYVSKEPIKETTKLIGQGGANYSGKKPWETQDWENPTQRSFDSLLNNPQGKQKGGDKNPFDNEFKDGPITTEGNQFFTPSQLENLKIDENEEFACYLMRMGEIFPNDDLNQALSVMQDEGVDARKLIDNIIPNLGMYYGKFMAIKLPEENINELGMDDFLETLEDVVDLLSDYENKFPFLPEVISDLQQLMHIIENKWRDVIFPGHEDTIKIVN